jgi:YgiT-type zinc finger domain-containing protein
LTRKLVSHTVTRKGYHLILDNVPAWVCEQCGEPLFDAETVDAIQAMVRAVESRLEKLNALAVAA